MPTNYTPGTATVIPNLPYAFTQDIVPAPEGFDYLATCFATHAYHAVWYTYTTGAAEICLSILVSRSGGDTNFPFMAVYTGPNVGALTQYTINTSTFCGSSINGSDTKLYFKVPVQPNTQYWFQFTDANNITGPATGHLVLEMATAPKQVSVRNATFCVTNGNQQLKIVNSELAAVATLNFTGTPILGIHANLPGAWSGGFYVVTNNNVLTEISRAGVVGRTWTIAAMDTANGPSIAVNREATILYHVSRANNSAIKRYDLVNSANLSDLHAGFAGESALHHGYVARDGSILFPFLKAGAPDTSSVRRFAPDGTLLQTYTNVPATIRRMAWGDDDPGSFWVWAYNNAIASPALMRRLRLSTGGMMLTLEVPVNVVSQIASQDGTQFGIANGGWFLKANEGLLIADDTEGFPTAVVSMVDGDRDAFLTLPSGDIYSVNEAAIMAPAVPDPVVIPDPVSQWRLHRCDSKPRLEQTT